MKKLSEQIRRAIQNFEKEILPKAQLTLNNARDSDYLQQRLAELRRIQDEAAQAPVFSIRFLGDTQNGKSTLINVLLGKKILPEGHVGACSATIVRCRHAQREQTTVEFRYCTEEAFEKDLQNKLRDAEAFLDEEASEAKRRETVCELLSRFLRLFGIDPANVSDLRALIEQVRSSAAGFPERQLLGTAETVEANAANEDRIHENLSAKGKRAFIIDECLIEGPFGDWHPSMELVDMPGTNAFNPYDDQVNARLKQKLGGLAIVTKETQLHDSVMDWFKDSSILPDMAGASERNQVRVFVLKTFIDKLNLPDGEDEKSQWEKTQEYCGEIEKHLRRQVMDLVGQRFSAPNEVEVLSSFVDRMPVCFLSPKVFRNLADAGLRNRVLKNPMQHLDMAAAFERFDKRADNTGVPSLRAALHQHTQDFITSHFQRKLELDFRKEVGLVAQFFRVQRVGIERRLADQGAFVLEVDGQIRADLSAVIKTYRQSVEGKILELKNRFNDEVGTLLDEVTADFGEQTRQKLEDWMELHWASLRCAGRKNGQHTTTRGHEIDFNGDLAEICVRALNSSWIKHRANLRKLLYNDLVENFLPAVEKVVAQAKGQDQARIELIESTYEPVAESARQELALQVERYDSGAEEFDALRPKLTLAIREFLAPTYEGISSEFGKGSSAKMRGHLQKGVLSSVHQIGRMVKQVVKKNWQGLTGALETRVGELFETVEGGFNEQGEALRRLSEHPSSDDEERAATLRQLETAAGKLAGKHAEREEAA